MNWYEVWDGSEKFASMVTSIDADMIVDGLKQGTFYSYRGDTIKRTNAIKKAIKTHEKTKNKNLRN